jgi:FKBP-type peptidyl-prolyl cis-trans isomerase
MEKRMNKIALTFALTGALISTSGLAQLDTENSQINYKIGSDVGQYMSKSEMEFDKDAFITGLEDGLAGRDLRLSDEELNQVQTIIREKQQKLAQERQKEMMAQLEEQKVTNKKEGDEFRAKKAKEDGVKTTDSGLMYEVIEAGSGDQPASENATVVVHYTGTLLDGTKFDSSVDRGQPATFALNQVIPGWTEGLQLMKKGAKYRFYIPPELAYGSDARPGSPIGPNSTLIFDVELIDINPNAEKPKTE